MYRHDASTGMLDLETFYKNVESFCRPSGQRIPEENGPSAFAVPNSSGLCIINHLNGMRRYLNSISILFEYGDPIPPHNRSTSVPSTLSKPRLNDRDVDTELNMIASTDRFAVIEVDFARQQQFESWLNNQDAGGRTYTDPFR